MAQRQKCSRRSAPRGTVTLYINHQQTLETQVVLIAEDLFAALKEKFASTEIKQQTLLLPMTTFTYIHGNS